MEVREWCGCAFAMPDGHTFLGGFFSDECRALKGCSCGTVVVGFVGAGVGNETGGLEDGVGAGEDGGRADRVGAGVGDGDGGQAGQVGASVGNENGGLGGRVGADVSDGDSGRAVESVSTSAMETAVREMESAQPTRSGKAEEVHAKEGGE